MLILLTNDDGITAPGLVALYHELTKMGEVVVVAPDSVKSAAGHGITLSAPVMTAQVNVEGAFTGTAVGGSPADCVKLAIAKILPRKPDLVVSGMNSGANVGINVIYSGTVAAAIEAAFLGLPAVALSLYLRSDIPTNYSTSARFGREVVEDIVKTGLAGGQVVSVNVPPVREGLAPLGVKVARQCVRPWDDDYDEREDPRGQKYYWNNTRFRLDSDEDDSDVVALRDGYITVTPLQFDMTHYKMLREWESRKWNTPKASRSGTPRE